MHIKVIDAAKACDAMYAVNAIGSPGTIEGYTSLHYVMGRVGFGVSNSKPRPTCAVYKKDGADAYIIAIRGSIMTESDWTSNNAKIGLNLTPDRAKETLEFVRRQQLGRAASEFVIAGHSLGGGLAQLVGYYTKNHFIGFNAPGMRSTVTGLLLIGSAGTGLTSKTKSWDYDKGCVFNTSNDPISQLPGRFVGRDYKVFSTIPYSGAAHMMPGMIEGLQGGLRQGGTSVLSVCGKAS